ncbi:Reverse transcriptase domain [Trinorchestia longiramus]|nr:Reverse transcriptase domain [Trinorchestia longiramus]
MELQHYMLKHHIHVALIQETKLQHQHRTSTIPNYSVIRQDRQHGEGGELITYIHHNINYIDMSWTTHNLLRINRHTERQSFELETGTNNDITTINAYIPPDTSLTLPAGYKPNLHALNTHRNIILCGDFDIKHCSWFTQQQNNTRAAGFDNISNHHLKHLRKRGIRTLTNITNYSYKFCRFPTLWKFGKIIALLKPNRSPRTKSHTDQSPCSASLLKLYIERLVLKVATQHIPLSPTLHGYRPHHSTTMLLTNMAQNLQDNINSRRPAKRTLLLTIAISKAFDTIDISKAFLIKKIYNTESQNNTKRWLANYLSGKQAHVHYRGKFSKRLNISNGIPQNSVLSPTLFNLYMHDISQPPENVHIASYADDITITSTQGNVGTCSIQVQDYMNTITTWMNTNRLKIAPTKSTATLLTSHNAEHQHRPTVTLQNTTIPQTHTTKILGVTFNTFKTFSQHIDEVSEKCNKRLNTPHTNRHQLRTRQRNLDSDL